jgi:hypothetical protein
MHKRYNVTLKYLYFILTEQPVIKNKEGTIRAKCNSPLLIRRLKFE